MEEVLNLKKEGSMSLTDMKGIGVKRAKRLRNIGIYTVRELAQSSVEDLSKKLGISHKVVSRWIRDARTTQEEAMAPEPKVPEKPMNVPQPVMSKTGEEVYNLLRNNGPTRTPMIAKSLNLPIPQVIEALKELKSLGKVQLSYPL